VQEQEENKLSTEDKGWLGKIKDSIFENWQTVLVALIVLIVGISAYNYNSKSNSNPAAPATAVTAGTDQDQVGKTDQEAAAENKDQEVAKTQDQASSATTTQDNNTAAPQSEPAKETNKETTVTAAQNTNSVTTEGENYKVAAVRGEGLTHLARKALNKYLEENKDDQLTALHKIYIEDYLRKQITGAGKTGVKVGQEEAFSKSSIEQAVAASKKLSQKSLDNLKKYQVAK
jgi:hypothetical protein